MVSEDELRRKRIYVGVFSVACIAGAIALSFFPGSEGFQGALVRVGVLLGALWLALPTKSRRAAWSGLSSNWAIFGGVFLAIVIPRLRMMFPVLAIVLGIAWFAKPRK